VERLEPLPILQSWVVSSWLAPRVLVSLMTGDLGFPSLVGRSKEMPADMPDRDSAFRNLIKAAWRFLDHTKNQSELQDMQEYRDLARAMNEAASANSK
jgi:hypothetical protein